jgi:tetratricopeptide (TPR) repeat protein
MKRDSSATGSRSSDSEKGSSEKLKAVLKKAKADPNDPEVWDELEAIAAETQKPDDVAAAYRKALASAPSPELATNLGQRGLRFMEDWYAGETAIIVEFLDNILQLDPAADWALERLTILLSVGEQWTELLAVYDRILAGLADSPRFRRLLQEAATVARDSGNSARAASYLRQLFEATPGTAAVSAELEHLLEKLGDFATLASVLAKRLALASGHDAVDLRQRLASIYLDRLGQPDKVLDEVDKLLVSPALADDRVACALAEKILGDETLPHDLRRRALATLRARHLQQGRPDRVVAALRVALIFATPDETRVLVSEAADMLERAGDLVAAREQLVELVALKPEEAATRARLKFLAEVTASPEAYVRGLSAAATATTDPRLQVALWLEAAQIEEMRSGGTAAAIAFHRQTLASSAAQPEQVLTAMRKLAALLTDQGSADERLDVLERQAGLEATPGMRRGLLGEAAELAYARGQIDRALGLWEKRLAADANDRKALARTIEILEGAQRWPELVVALARRADADVPWIQRRADWLRIAEIERDRHGDPVKAIAALGKILQRSASDGEAVTAILDLFAQAGRWQDLLGLGTQVGDRLHGELVALFVRLGDACRTQLADPQGAATWYGRALAADPQAQGLRDALLALAEDETARAAAVEGLVRCSAATDDWQGLLAILPHRLALATGDDERARLLAEAALLEEKRGQRPKEALAHHCTVLQLRPDDAQTEAAILRLAEATGDFDLAARTLQLASAGPSLDTNRKVHLLLAAGRLFDDKTADKPAALACFEKAFAAAPTERSVRLGVVRVASELGVWQTAVDAALAEPFEPGALLADFLPLMEQSAATAAEPPGSLRLLGKTLSATLAAKASVPVTIGRTIEERIAGYAVAPEKAAGWQERALLRARDYEPSHLPTLRRLAEAQRGRGGKPLYETLMQIAVLAPRELDAIVEALDVADKKDASLARAALTTLFERASGLLRAGQAAEGKTAAADGLVRATQGLADMLGASRDKAEVRRAVDFLLEASRLPVPAEVAQALRAQAGELAMEVDKKLARELLRQTVDQDPKNRNAAKALARLYEEADLLSDLLTLRRRELDDAASSDDRLFLRLDIARLGEIVESRTGRLEILLANLEDSPGHAATLTALGMLLRSRGRHAELADILAAQARKLEEQNDSLPAANLWSQAAAIFEKPLGDEARAIGAYEKVAALAADPAAMEALARLYESAGEPLAAASWLEQRMSTGAPAEKRQAVVKLAQTYLDGGQRHRAVAALERALGEDPTAAELWNMLARLHREAHHDEALVRVLSACCAHTDDAETVVASAHEVLALCQERLKDPARAVPVLERAVALAPGERSLRLALADGLRVSGRYADARAVLEGLLEEFGRRQSRERAGLHLQIATVARAEKALDLAAKHLDQAAAVLLDNVDVQLALAEVAEERGEVERAEKAYRALLVLARRGHGDGTAITAGEVLVRLRRLALAQGQQVQAAENLESAIARALHDPVEARRIQAALLADGDNETLLALLAKRRTSAAHISDEALVVCELAAVLEKIGRADEGLTVLLEILAKVPDSAEAHTLARGIASRLGKADAYLDAVTGAAEKLRRADDAPCLADLLLRAADVAEKDLHLLDKAVAYLRRAEQTNRRGAEVLGALARVAASTGDAAEFKRAVSGLRRLAQAASAAAEKSDLYYRLAEAQVPQVDARDEGLDALAQAMEILPDLPRATSIVQNAQVPDTALVRVLPVYEKVARASNDDRVLLDFLDRRAALPGAQLGEVREGVELAVSLGEGERAERMLAHAIEIARQSRGGLREGVWAVIDLSRRLRARGDLAGAARVLEDVRDEWANPRLTPLVRETAKAAAASNDSAAVAAQLLDHLRVVNPTDREVWEPLLELWARLGNRGALEGLVQDLVAKLMSRGDRSAVRLAWARFLLASGDAGENVSAALRDVLLEEPGHSQALTLLADVYEERGDVGEAVTLLSDALSSGEGAASGAGRATLARRLGDLVKKADPAQAKEVYRSALATPLPDATVKRSLQQSLVELLTAEGEAAERAALCEEILLGESGETAAAQSLALFELRLQINDDSGAERALCLGHERTPDNAQVFEQLGKFYTQREMWADATALLGQEAGRLSRDSRDLDVGKATRLYRKVAHLQRDKLGDVKAAAQTLRQAVQIDPSDFDLVRELCDSFVEAGDPGLAVAAVGEILATEVTPSMRIGLLRLRADLSARQHDDEAAVRDLEEALSLGAADASADLAAALSRVAGRAASAGDRTSARAASLRLAEILRVGGDDTQADQVLFRWIEACPDDREVLYQMRDIFTAGERWESAANVWARLVHLEEGEAKAQAALALTAACEKLGRAEEAIPWLSGVLAHVPGHRELQARLAALYETTGNMVESARLRYLMADNEPDENERFRLYVQIGQALLAAGQGADAALALEKSLALPAADRATRALLLDAYVAAGTLDRASAVLTELLADAKTMKPEELATLYRRQSKIAAATGDRDGQLQALKKALDTDRKSVSIANELADLAESIGDDDLALRALRVVAASPIKDSKVVGLAYLRQARIAHRAKDRSRAIIFVKRALQEDPDLEEARALLDQLR